MTTDVMGPLLGWALGLGRIMWGYWGDWDLLGNDVSGAIMGPTGVAGVSVGGVLGSLGLWGGYWSHETPPLGVTGRSVGLLGQLGPPLE